MRVGASPMNSGGRGRVARSSFFSRYAGIQSVARRAQLGVELIAQDPDGQRTTPIQSRRLPVGSVMAAIVEPVLPTSDGCDDGTVPRRVVAITEGCS
jgi:hypothetical protein